jgi:RNA polymerase-binding transcription factor
MTPYSTRFTVPPPTGIRPELATHLPDLHGALIQQRRFRRQQLAELNSVMAASGSSSGTTDSQAQVNRAIRAGALVALADIETALQRMASGQYGRCQHCAAEIPLGRLEVLPSVALCMPCQYLADACRG